MPKLGQLVRYRNSDGADVLAQVVALSKDAKQQVEDGFHDCGRCPKRKEIALHTTEKGESLTDANTVELVELEERVLGKDPQGNLIMERRIVGGRQRVPLAATVDARNTPHTWWPDAAGEEG